MVQVSLHFINHIQVHSPYTRLTNWTYSRQTQIRILTFCFQFQLKWWGSLHFRGWADQVETNCDDNRKGLLPTYSFDLYWIILQCITVWIPNLIMVFSWICLSYKLKRSVKMFPYLSGSRNLRFFYTYQYNSLIKMLYQTWSVNSLPCHEIENRVIKTIPLTFHTLLKWILLVGFPLFVD